MADDREADEENAGDREADENDADVDGIAAAGGSLVTGIEDANLEKEEEEEVDGGRGSGR